MWVDGSGSARDRWRWVFNGNWLLGSMLMGVGFEWFNELFGVDFGWELLDVDKMALESRVASAFEQENWWLLEKEERGYILDFLPKMIWVIKIIQLS